MPRPWFTATAPAPDPGVATLDHAQRGADDATTWLANNWADWLVSALQIALIMIGALVLRVVVRKMITRLISRMNRNAESKSGTLHGFLVNAERRRQRSEAIGSVLRSVASFVILGTAVLTVLPILHINLAPLLASAGVAGVAVGFGARNLVTDFLSGVFMILEDQYGVGDVIDAGVASGTVIEVGLRVTKLRGDNGEIWYVRNGEVSRIGNLSQGWAVATIDIQVAYSEDLGRAKALITAAAESMAKEEPWDEALWEPIQVLGLTSVDADKVVIQAQAKTMPGKAAGVARELRWRTKQAFDAEGIALVDVVPEATVKDAAANTAAPRAAAGAPNRAAAATPPEAAAGTAGQATTHPPVPAPKPPED